MKATLVTYHYVRPIEKSAFPNIKGLELNQFIEQLKYFSKNYDIISIDDLLEVVNSGNSKKINPLVLTFDDGYKDHLEYVLPELQKLKIKGAFFPVLDSCVNNKVLDVNKIHYLVAGCKDLMSLFKEIISSISLYKEKYNLNEEAFYMAKYYIKSRFGDDPETMFIKKMLQQGFPEALRNSLCNELCEKYLNLSEVQLNKILYMNLTDVKEMASFGMTIGGHSATHPWLPTLPEDKIKIELELSQELVFKVYNKEVPWIMCYPYGSYDEKVMEVLKKTKCKMALTTKHELFDSKTDSAFAIPRLDTNNLPKDSNMQNCHWLNAAIGN